MPCLQLGFAISKLAPGTMYYFRARVFFNNTPCHTSIATQYVCLQQANLPFDLAC